MSGRGRRASLPPADHARPEVLAPDGLVVHHYNKVGRVRDYDFAVLPVPEPMQRSLAALFAARCTPHRWTVHASSEAYWFALVSFAKFFGGQQLPPRDLDQLTAPMIKQWREDTLASSGRAAVMAVVSLLGEHPQLRMGPVADELARRVKPAARESRSYSETEFDRIKTAARRMFRTALLRIEDNARMLERWRTGQIPEGGRDWLVGETLDALARTGYPPHAIDRNGKKFLPTRHRRALGGAHTEVTWGGCSCRTGRSWR